MQPEQLPRYLVSARDETGTVIASHHVHGMRKALECAEHELLAGRRVAVVLTAQAGTAASLRPWEDAWAS